MRRRRTTAVIGFVTSLSLLLAGCAVATPSTDSGLPPLSPLDIIEEVQEAIAPTEDQIKRQMLDALAIECTNLSEYSLDPQHWAFDPNVPKEAPYNLYLDGDGGVLSVTFMPGNPGAVWLTPEYLEYSNDLAYYSGCTGIATEPIVDAGGGGFEQEVVQYVEMPNLVGYTEQEVRNWALGNSQWMSLSTRTGGLSPSADCLTNGWGVVTSQSPGPGRIEFRGAPIQVAISISCG